MAVYGASLATYPAPTKTYQPWKTVMPTAASPVVPGSTYVAPTAAAPTGRTDGRTWRADAGAWMNDAEYAQWRISQNTAAAGGGAAGGGGYAPTSLAAWTPPAIDLQIPNYAWSPTAEQQAGWGTVASARMALKYDPQRQEVINALTRYKQETELAQTRAGTSNVAQQLELANIIKNVGRQPIIESAIRRGAETSGWLPEALAGLGQYETTQRTGMTQNYNETIAELVRGVLNQETGTGERLTALSGLQGQDLISTLDALENRDRTRKMEELTQTFSAQYSKASLINQIAAEQKRAEQQDALIAAQMAQSQFENQMAEKNYALQQAQTAYNTTYRGGGTTEPGYLIPGSSDRYRYHGLIGTYAQPAQAEASFFDLYDAWKAKQPRGR